MVARRDAVGHVTARKCHEANHRRVGMGGWRVCHAGPSSTHTKIAIVALSVTQPPPLANTMSSHVGIPVKLLFEAEGMKVTVEVRSNAERSDATLSLRF